MYVRTGKYRRRGDITGGDVTAKSEASSSLVQGFFSEEKCE
jgi:hypothetical protein